MLSLRGIAAQVFERERSPDPYPLPHRMGERNWRMDDLQWLAETGQMKRGSEDGMSSEQSVQSALKFFLIEIGLNVEAENVVVNGRGCIQFIVEKHSQLEPGQRISVLGVSREFG